MIWLISNIRLENADSAVTLITKIWNFWHFKCEKWTGVAVVVVIGVYKVTMWFPRLIHFLNKVKYDARCTCLRSFCNSFFFSFFHLQWQNLISLSVCLGLFASLSLSVFSSSSILLFLTFRLSRFSLSLSSSLLIFAFLPPFRSHKSN